MNQFGVAWSRVRATVLPFLVLAYPVVFLQFQGGEYCGPLCWEPTDVGVAVVLGTLVCLALVARWVATRFEMGTPGRAGRFERWVAPPSTVSSIVLVLIFVAFVGLLVLDALTLYESIWKPIALPLSFLVYAPVWVLYMASFPIAIIVSILGIETPHAFTLLLRAVVVFLGFPLSVLLQARFLSALADYGRSTDR